MKLKTENFECVKEDNSEEENNRQWENSKIVFDEFKKYLSSKNYKDEPTPKSRKFNDFHLFDPFGG